MCKWWSVQVGDSTLILIGVAVMRAIFRLAISCNIQSSLLAGLYIIYAVNVVIGIIILA